MLYEVITGKGAIHMRTADQPWGPWSPPQDALVGGDPAASPPELQYAPGGVLRHPDCKGDACVGHTDFQGINPHEYGFLYAANIISEWTRPAPGGGADILWNVRITSYNVCYTKLLRVENPRARLRHSHTYGLGRVALGRRLGRLPGGTRSRLG